MAGKRVQRKTDKAIAYPIPQGIRLTVDVWDTKPGTTTVGWRTQAMMEGGRGARLLVFENTGQMRLVSLEDFPDLYEEIQ